MSAPQPDGFIKVIRKKRRKATDTPTVDLQSESADDERDTASKVTLLSDCKSDSQSVSDMTVRSSSLVGGIRDAVALRK